MKVHITIRTTFYFASAKVVEWAFESWNFDLTRFFRSFLLLVQKKEPKKSTPRAPTEILFGAHANASRADKISVRTARGRQPHPVIV